MADTSISNLGSISTLADADLFVAVDDTDTTTKNLTATVVLSYIQDNTDLTDLNNVDATSPTDGQVLSYDTASGNWQASSLSTAATVLDELNDVATASPSDGQVLTYDTASSLWEPADIPAVSIALTDITDVDTTTPTDGQVLAYDTSTSSWGPIDSVSGATDLDELNDVVVSTPLAGHILVYSTADTAFVNQAPDLSVELNTQTATSYTLVLGDAGGIIEMNTSAANEVVIPTNASVAFTVGTIVNVSQYGTGTTSITGTSGVTINGVSGGSADMNDQYDGATLYKRATDEWVLQGGVGAVA